MTKTLIYLLLALTPFWANCQSYSTSNKKAIKLFEQGQREPSLSLDPKGNRPNYPKGLQYLNMALEKDPNFWEAHLLAAEFSELTSDFKSAIGHYEAAIKINPNHSRTGSTYYYLGNLLQQAGDYEKSAYYLGEFLTFRGANPDMQKRAVLMKNCCEFALRAMKNPQEFNPINIGPGINTECAEYYPTITVDGKTILFTRRIKDPSIPKFGEQEDFYVSVVDANNTWQRAVSMPSNVNTSHNEGAPTISADGRSLIFVACSDFSGGNDYGANRTGKGSCDMFVTKKLGNQWSTPQNLPGNVNTFSWESQPSLSADGKTLYFIRRVSKKGEMPDCDIFISKLLDNGEWGTPIALPRNINTSMEEESVLIHPDGKTLYFASKGHIGMGGSDLYISRMDDNGNWMDPINLGYPINSKYDENSLMVSPDGEVAFFASDRKGGYGDLDIYYFKMPEPFRPTKTLYFDGIVFDRETKAPLAGKFQLIDLSTGKEVITSTADAATGEFLVSLPVNREYALNVSYPGYNFFSQNFNMTLTDEMQSVHMDVPLVPINSSTPVVLNNVFFDFGKSTLRAESNIELNKLFDHLNANAKMKIEIGGHTDTRGDAKENQVLSENRAKAVYTYLTNKGIDPKRMTFKGYGESKTVISDDQIAKLATEKEKEKAHQKNRRTEYKIIN
jgi:outer membrane protein OmpA-like peptidoglycan-associated protein